MVVPVEHPPTPPRHRWVWVLVLAPILPAINWFIARQDTIGVQGGGDGWLAVTGPRLPGIVPFLMTFALLGVVPLLLTRPILGSSPARLGLGAGRWRTSLLFAVIGVPLAVLVAYGSRGSEALAAVYPLGSPSLAPSSFLPHVVGYLLYYIGFEYFFRGFMLLGLEDRLGPKAANALQAGIVTLAHLGKPPIELLAAYPASLLFGWMTLRTRAIWAAVAVHWAVGVALDYFLLTGP